jgi:hypothetical protein
MEVATLITQADPHLTNGPRLRAAVWSFAAKTSIFVMGLIVLPLLTYILTSIKDHEVRTSLCEQTTIRTESDIVQIKLDVREVQRTNASDHQLIKERLGGIAEDMSAVKAKMNGGE